MINTPSDALVFEAFVGDRFVELESPLASEIVATLKRPATLPEATIRPRGIADFPRAALSFHGARGFVLQCYEHERSWSDFLVTGDHLSPPAVEIQLGGQSLERWPPELFVSEQLVLDALQWFLAKRTQKPNLHWVRIDAFAREVVWDDAEGRAAWSTQQGPDAGDA